MNKNTDLEYQYSYWKALAENEPQKAKTIEKEYQIFSKEANKLKAKKEELIKLIKLANNSLKNINKIYTQIENNEINNRKAIDFLEKTLENRINIMKFISAYKKATDKTRNAFRKFSAANDLLEKIAGTTSDPNFNYHLFIESCKELEKDINQFLARE